MKTARLCIGIVSIVLFAFIMFQSCAAGIGEALSGDESGASSTGVFVAWLILIAGIIAICTRKGVVGAYISAGFYALAGIFGISSIDSTFGDLIVWGVLSFIFAIIFVAAGIITKKSIQAEREAKE